MRMAIGASPEHIIRLILREGAQLAIVGLVLGLIGALIVGQAVQGLLFGVPGHDPLTFGTAPLLLAIAALLACYVPARRAANISPVTALGR